jgi:hypothetical protein
MPRKLLLFAVVAVIGSMLVLWLATRNSKSEPEASTEPQGEDRSRIPERDRMRAERANPTLPDQPAAGSGSGEVRPDFDQRGVPKNHDPDRPLAAEVTDLPRGTNAHKVDRAPIEYTLPDGRKVRDWRSPEQRRTLELPPSLHPPGGRRIRPELTGGFTDQIMAHLKECKKAVPTSALGTKPRAEGQILIAIKDEQAYVTGATLKVTEISDASVAESARTCVEQKTLTVKVPAPGEADLDSYSITVSYAF